MSERIQMMMVIMIGSIGVSLAWGSVWLLYHKCTLPDGIPIAVTGCVSVLGGAIGGYGIGKHSSSPGAVNTGSVEQVNITSPTEEPKDGEGSPQ